MEYKDLIIPTMNVNDTKVIISDIRKQNLDYIEEGEVLYSVETSKATEEYKADFSGYVVLYVNDMDEVEVGKSAGKIFKSLGDAKIEYEEIRNLLDEVNPIISKILEMKVRDEASVQEIADTLGVSKRNVYFYLNRARAIGQRYNNGN